MACHTTRMFKMTRGIWTKWILGSVLLIIIGGIAFIVLMEIDTARFKRQVMQQRNEIQEHARAASVKQSTQEVTSAESETPTPEKPITLTKEVKTVPERLTETKAPQQTILPAETTDNKDVSAFGFGPFPKVPEGMDLSPIWQDPDYLTYELSRDMELMERVWIKAWEEGKRDIIGASIENDIVYLNFPNTIYIWYEEYEDDEGEYTHLRTGGAGDVNLRIEDIQSGNIPPGIRIIDGKTAGIDPFEYLNLNQ